jgi:MoaA/NifB/PqqE/SkfB family radical SAM enzyme
MPEMRRGNSRNALSRYEYCKIIEDAAQAGMFCLEISGEGEPLLSINLNTILQCAFDNGFITTLITNGHNLTKEFVQFIFERNVTLIVSLFSNNRELYELDNNLPESFDKTMANIRMASNIFKQGKQVVDGKVVYRMAIHTTAQSDNLAGLNSIKSLCEEYEMFFSIAELAPTGGGSEHPEMLLECDQEKNVRQLGDNSIILSKTSKDEVGREVCGTCFYGLNIGYDGNVLFDAHAGYEVGGLLGNVRKHSIEELVIRQREFARLLFDNIEGFCPVRDKFWPSFLQHYIKNPLSFEVVAAR